MILTILLILAVVIGALAAFIASRPSQFHVTRSATLPAPPAVVFDEVNDLHHFQAWSPWARLDPNSKLTYSGPIAGEGASFTWSGSNKVGEGTMTITESRPAELVAVRLDFVKPFKGTNQVQFTFQPATEGTLMTWSMTGTANFVFKAMGLFMDCDKMCGDQFEQGLANLHEIVSQPATAQP